MKKNKLQNIKAVQEMIDGTHKFQTKKTVGFSDAESTSKKNAKHEIGEIWEEFDSASGVTYVIEQRDGFRVRKPKNSEVFQEIRDELRIFKNCRKETCTCVAPNHIDEKMRKVHNMCFDCVIEMEHDLKKEGTYEEYERGKIRANALSWLASAEQDMKLLKTAYTQAMEFVSSTNGDVEHWSAKMTKEEFEEKIETDFTKFKEDFISKLLDGKQQIEKQDETN